MTERSDDQLMLDYARGDENALRILVQRWERQVFAFLYRMLGSAEEAEDLCQESFMNLIKASGNYRPDGKFQSWLFRIAGNKARSRLRRRKIIRWVSLTTDNDNTPAPESDALETLAELEQQRMVQQAIARLPQRQQQALVLKQYQAMSYQEIADTMETSVPSVQMLLHRAMNAMRKDLTSQRGEK